MDQLEGRVLEAKGKWLIGWPTIPSSDNITSVSLFQKNPYPKSLHKALSSRLPDSSPGGLSISYSPLPPPFTAIRSVSFEQRWCPSVAVFLSWKFYQISESWDTAHLIRKSVQILIVYSPYHTHYFTGTWMPSCSSQICPLFYSVNHCHFLYVPPPF